MSFNQAGIFTLFSIIYLLFLSMGDVNCCGCMGGGGGGGDGPGLWESRERAGQGTGGGGGSNRNVHTPVKATVVELAAPETQRIEMGYNGKLVSGAGTANEIATTKVGQNKQNNGKSKWSKIAKSLGIGGHKNGSNPAAGHRGNGTHSPGRGRR